MANIKDMIPAFELLQPTTIEAAIDLIDEHRSEGWVLAGGLDSFDWFKDRIKRPTAVIDLGGIEELRGISGVRHTAIRQELSTFRDKYLLSAKHIAEVLEYTNHPNQFKLHLLDGDEWQPDAKFASHAYYAMYADICVALYEHLQKDEEVK